MLKTDGTKILENGKELKLRGYCLGNWMMMENFMMGFPGTEQQFRKHLKEYAGEEKGSFFIDRLMEYYFEEEDIKYLKSLGVNVIRLPFNYRHFEEDEQPFVYKEEGFHYIDKAVRLCKKYGIYLILDLHGAQGYQGPDWHCDNYEREVHLYEDEVCQKRVVQLWRYIAEYYKDEETIAAYDLLNEPVARGEKSTAVLDRLYYDIVQSIREVDPLHMVVIRGNYWGQEFEGFRKPFDDNMMYACHYYTEAGLQQTFYPKKEGGTPANRETVKAGLQVRDHFIRENNVPCWVSEFGLLEDNPVYHESKLETLKDQLSLFNEAGHNWTMWSYKDVGNMGLVRPRKDTPWAMLTKEIIRLKKKYYCDYNTIISERWMLSSLIKQYVGDDLGEYYEEARDQWENELAKIFNNVLAKIFAQKLASFSEQELDELAASYKFENCDIMKEWAELIRSALQTEETGL